jgi:DNA-binding CsgD family transcriptional regulator/PAS domain-containing protein
MRAENRDHLLDTIAKIHRAGLKPETWPEALDAISRCVGSPRAVLYSVQPGDGSVLEFRSHNIDPAYGSQYLSYYHQVDPWLECARHLAYGRPLRGTEIIPDTKMTQTEHYNDFLKPQDIRFLLTAITGKTPARMDILSVFHRVKQDDFDDSSVRIYETLIDHVAQALNVERALDGARVRSRGLAAALDHVPKAILLLNRGGTVVHANAAAERLLSAADGLSVTNGRLEATSPGARKSLDGLLQHAADASDSTRFKRRMTNVPRISGRRSYVVRAVPIESTEDLIDVNDLPELPRVLVTVSDPEAKHPAPAVSELQTVYGLTPAEANLAVELSRGATLARIAQNQGIAVATVRKYLRSVFDKTGIHRQAELVQRLMTELGDP